MKMNVRGAILGWLLSTSIACVVALTFDIHNTPTLMLLGVSMGWVGASFGDKHL